jgi:hypothetical protein
MGERRALGGETRHRLFLSMGHTESSLCFRQPPLRNQMVLLATQF